MNDTILNNYQRWTERAIADVDVINELKDIAENEEKIEDAFYKDLAFGTGGLRGVIGAGTNRLNVYTVAKASQGLADYVIKNFAPEKRKIAVSFDSRIKSDVFAKVASGVFAANGIKVEIYSELMPCVPAEKRNPLCGFPFPSGFIEALTHGLSADGLSLSYRQRM